MSLPASTDVPRQHGRVITVQRAGEDDWQRVRRTRLAALTDAPEAFGSSLAREQGFKENHWRMRLRSSDWWLAGTGTRAPDAGIVSAIREPGAPADHRHVMAMWVAPEHRRAGVGRALLAALLDDVVGHGARTVTLWLLEGNAAAAALYRSSGFAPTGVRTPLARDPSRTEERWARTV